MREASRVLGKASVVAGVVLLALPAVAPAGDALRLAQRYAPVVMLKTQKKECGKGEAFRPTSVDVVIDNPDVILRDGYGRVAAKGPTAKTLYGKSPAYHLDLPGDPLHPGCGFERDFRRWSAGQPAVTYAHVVTERGRLAVQYWLYYTFNNFNDKHESDWEFVQVVFGAPTVEQALAAAPVEVGASQHEGGERAGWSDDRLRKEGTHPVIYPGAGSHANYYSEALWLGRSAKQGFGCDDTEGPSSRTLLDVRLLPSSVSGPGDPNAWLGYPGRWGQKEAAFNNGPPGPQVQDAWTKPISWQGNLRDGAVAIPGRDTFGPSVTSFFCGAVAKGSDVFIFMTTKPWGFLGLGLLLLAAVIAAFRDAGHILRAALRSYVRNLRLFAGIGVIFVPVSLVFGGLQYLLFQLTGLRDLIAVAGRGNLVSAFAALLVGALGVLIASVVVGAAVAVAVGELDAGRAVRPWQAYRSAFERLGELARAVVGEVVLVVLLLLSIVGIPFAIHLLVRWAFVAQTAVIEDLPARQALERSADLVRGRWWRVFGITATINVLAVLSGPIVGVTVLLTATNASLDAINLIGSLVYTFTVPLAAIAITLLYRDLAARPPLRGLRLVGRHRAVHQAS
jgi:hypothetical protein